MSQITKTATHHDRILQDLRQSILGGRWAPGFRLPFELDLAQQYGVSRMTMNKVLTQLTREGFLVRRRKLGTFVAAPRTQSAIMEIADTEAEVRALGLAYRFELKSRQIRTATDDEIRSVGASIDDARDVLALQGVHYAGGAPFCLEHRLINFTAAPAAATHDFNATAPGGWLLKQIPWSEAEHTIRAKAASADDAKNLNIATADPCLEVSRRTEFSGDWVTYAVLTYPANRHQIVAQFEPGSDRG